MFAARDGHLVVEVETTAKPTVEVGLTGNYWESHYANQTAGLGSPIAYRVRWSRQDVRNRVSVSQVGGTAYTTSDATSVGAHGLHTYSRTDFIIGRLSTGSGYDYGPDYSAYAAGSWLARFKDPAGRLQSVTWDVGRALLGLPAQDHGLTWLLANVNPTDRVKVTLPADEGGKEWKAEGRALGIEWDIGPQYAYLTLTLDSPVAEV
jgi:hypothetical protein